MFYDRFIELCEAKRQSPSFVVQAIGLNKSNATYWKKGSIPKSDTLHKLADYFHVTTDYLLDLSQDDQAIIERESKRISELTGRPFSDVRDALVEMKAADIFVESYHAAMNASDITYVEAFSWFSDDELEETMLDAFRSLNRRGQLEAFERVLEMTEQERFRDPTKNQSQNPTPEN